MNKLEQLRNIEVSVALGMNKVRTTSKSNGFCCFGYEEILRSLDLVFFSFLGF